jgi:hypothetical protein
MTCLRIVQWRRQCGEINDKDEQEPKVSGMFGKQLNAKIAFDRL